MGKKQRILFGKFGRLTVTKEVERYRTPKGTPFRQVLCKCDCGSQYICIFSQLKSGKIKSCGCLKNELTSLRRKTHGMSKTPIYFVWQSMKRRCCDPNDKSYKNYGGRGIKVCDRWLSSFQNFYEDIGEGYRKGLSIERIDNDGNYCLENCKWIPLLEQSRNKRSTRMIEHEGIVLNVTQWEKKFGFKLDFINSKLRQGLTFEQIIKLKKYERTKLPKTA